RLPAGLSLLVDRRTRIGVPAAAVRCRAVVGDGENRITKPGGRIRLVAGGETRERFARGGDRLVERLACCGISLFEPPVDLQAFGVVDRVQGTPPGKLQQFAIHRGPPPNTSSTEQARRGSGI